MSVPYSTGEQYEGAAHLISMVQDQAIKDREEMIQDLLAKGRIEETYSIPEILHAFTMLFFKEDSKVGCIAIIFPRTIGADGHWLHRSSCIIW